VRAARRTDELLRKAEREGLREYEKLELWLLLSSRRRPRTTRRFFIRQPGHA
jgi:hypothetical protein